MLNILLVDDNAIKSAKIVDLIDTTIIIGDYKLVKVENAYDAYTRLVDEVFDLLILDINIPLRPGALPKRDGGISLLNTIVNDTNVLRPAHLVGLTEYEDIVTDYAKKFSDKLLYLIKYDDTSKSWSDALSEKILHILACKTIVKKKIKILFLAADPSNMQEHRLMLDVEARTIQDKLRLTELRDSFEFECRWAVRIDDILLAFNEVKPHIVHFTGHGTSSGNLVFLDDRGKPALVSIEGIDKLFEVMKKDIKLVLLSACYSNLLADVIIKHVDCCIAMNDTISVAAAIDFASSFYQALGCGVSVKNAFDQGLTTLLLKSSVDKDVPEFYCKMNTDPSSLFFIQ